MEVKIYEHHKTEKVINIDFPYCFHWHGGDNDYECDTYGKIENGYIFKICKKYDYRSNDESIEIEKERFDHCHSYFKPSDKITEEDFKKVRDHALKFLTEEKYDR